MAVKKCPICGLPIGNSFDVCPVCGARVEDEAFQPPVGEPFREVAQAGKMRLTVWDMLFIIICNLSFVAILINVIMGGVCWCYYPVFGLFTLYFIAFSICSGTVKRFITRYRNAVMGLNLIAGIFYFITRWMGAESSPWAFNYFIPVNLLTAGVVLVCLLGFQSISMRTVLLSMAMLFSQSFLQFVFMLFGWTAQDTLSRILVSVAFGVNLITLVNLVFLYFIKYRTVLQEKFHLWE